MSPKQGTEFDNNKDIKTKWNGTKMKQEKDLNVYLREV